MEPDSQNVTDCIITYPPESGLLILRFAGELQKDAVAALEHNNFRSHQWGLRGQVCKYADILK